MRLRSPLPLGAAFAVPLCLAVARAEPVLITEIQYHPREGDPEFLEISNRSATPIDIASWQFTDGVDYTFPAFSIGTPQASFLQAFESIVVTNVDEATFRAATGVPPTTRVFGPWDGSLSNGGERVSLSDKNGLVRTTVEYEDRGRWPTAADGTGHTLTFLDPHGVSDDPANWGLSSSPGGTPGTPEIASAEEPVTNPEVNLATGIPFIEFGETWRYHNTGTDLGTSWRELNYNESTHPGWQSGQGILGFESSALPPPGLRTDFFDEPGFDRVGRRTYYYRKTFNYTGPTTGASISIDQIIDDGVVYYLNGTELGRVGVDFGPVTWNTLAGRTVGDGELETDAVTFNNAPLVNGTNVLAAEVHQTNDTSSDSVFDCRFKIATPSEPSAVINEVLALAGDSGFVEFFNPTGAAIDLGGFHLSDDPGDLTQFTIPGSLTVPPGGFASVGFASSGLSLGDPLRVYLTAPDGTSVTSAISSSVPLDGRSVGRKPSGSSNWFLFVSPTPGSANQSATDLEDAIALNEAHFNTDGVLDWVEVTNSGGAVADLSGLVVATRPDLADAVALTGSVAPGAQVSFNTAWPDPGGSMTLFLATAGGTVIDAARINPSPTYPGAQAFPDGSGEWFASTNSTRNAPNSVANRTTGIVINEIMFAPPSEHRDGEFIELHNHSGSPVDVSGFQFTDGVGFTFPQGSTIPSGGFLVVAANLQQFSSAHPGVAAVGDFDGTLRDSGEFVRLVDATGNFVDEVDYKAGEPWPLLTDGAGSSMELIHPSLDNSLPSAWAASDESSKSTFRPFTHTGTYQQLRSDGSPSDYKELHFHLVGDSHVALRNIQLRRNGAGSNLLTNSTRISPNGSSSSGWLVQGTHAESHFQGSEFHLVADGHGDQRANRVEVDCVAMNRNDSVTLTFEARWISGKSRLIAQTWDHSVGQIFDVTIPENLGTPGAANSASASGPTPQVDGVLHSPAVPRPGNPVTVSARVSSPGSPLTSVRVFHRLDNTNASGTWVSTAMTDAGDGLYTANISNYTGNGNLVQFYVQAENAAGNRFEIPRGAAARPAMWVVDDSSPNTDLRVQRFVVSAYDLDAISRGDNQNGKFDYKYPRLSNHYKNATLIADENRIVYNAEIRNSGSPWTRGNNLDRGKWKPPRSFPFRGREKNSLDNDASNGSRRHHNRLVRYWLYLLGHAENENEYIQVVYNTGGSGSGLKEEVEPVANDFIRRNWEEGTSGELYRIDDEWWFQDNWSRSQRDADWRHKGSDEATRYHSEWIRRSREQEHDYSTIIDFFRLARPQSGSPTYNQEQIERYLDRRAVGLMTAVRGYIADWDSFTLDRGKNGYFYKSPQTGQFQFLHWDSDLAFRQGDIGRNFYSGRSGFPEWVSKDYNRREVRYWLGQLTDHYTGGSARVSAWLNAEESASSSYSVTSFYEGTWFPGRDSRARSELGSDHTRSFTITTPGGTTSADTVNLSGTMPTTVYSVQVAGHPEGTFSSTGIRDWSLSGVQLRSGVNSLTVQGIDHAGNVVESAPYSITKTGSAAPVVVVETAPGKWRAPLDEPMGFDASASYDPEGDPITFDWTPPVGTAYFTGADSSAAEAGFLTPGHYTIQLAVTDDAAVTTNLIRQASVYASGDFDAFNGAVLSPGWTATNVVPRGNETDTEWYSLDDVPGSLLVQVQGDSAKPFSATGAFAHPWVYREVPPPGEEWSMETEVNLETVRFGDFEAGLMVEYRSSPSAVQRHWIGIRDGQTVSSSAGVGPALTGSSARFRMRQTASNLTFELQLEPGLWQTFATTSVPAGSSVQAGPHVATGSASPLRVAFDYALVVDPDIPTEVLDNLRIAEIHADPSGGSDLEFIEFVNAGTVAINLEGVRFDDGRPFDEYVLPNYNLAPGARAVIVANTTAFRAHYGNGVPVIGQWSGGKLDNAGERIVLRDASGNVIHDFDYPPVDPARSLEIVSLAGDYGDESNWRGSTEFDGSPGFAGSPPDTRIVVNEVLSHTDPPLTDSIELVNTTGSPVSIGGWFLSDSSSDYKKFAIPAGTVLPAGGAVVFDEADFNPVPGVPPSFALDGAGGDSVYLVEGDGSGNITAFVDDVHFPAAFNGESFGRWPDASGELTPMLQRSLGAPNTGPRIGPLLVSEVMVAPPSGDADLEFIEIYNPTANPVLLGDWRVRGGADYDFAPTDSIPAYDTVVVVRFDPAAEPSKKSAFEAAYGITGAGVRIVGGYGPDRLDDDGESIVLQRPDEPPVDDPGFIPRLTEDVAAWASDAGGSGDSWHRNGRSGHGSFDTSWRAGAATPGNPAFADTYEAWAATQLPGGGIGAGENDDPDGDGRDNVLEYAFDTPPLIADPLAVPALTFDGSLAVVTYPRDTSKSDLSITLEQTDGAAPWSISTDVLIGTEGYIEARAATSPAATQPSLLYRVRATK